MKILTADGSLYNLPAKEVDELRDTYDCQTVHEIFEEATVSVKEEHRYEVWLAVG